jgi:hypothetical protein
MMSVLRRIWTTCLATIGTLGIDVLERQPKLPSSVLEKKFEEEVEPGEDLGLDFRPQALLNRPTIRSASTCARWA